MELDESSVSVVWIGPALALLVMFAVSFCFDKFNVGLVGEIGVGIVLQLSGLLNADHVEALQLIAVLALFAMLAEGGLNSDAEILKRFAKNSIVIAVIGTVSPMLFGYVLFLLAGYDHLAAIIGGTSLSSSSMGTSLRLLVDAGVLSSPLGASLVAASMLDDVISLIALGVLLSIGARSESSSLAGAILQPLAVAIGSFVLSILLLRLLLPMALKRCLHWFGLVLVRPTLQQPLCMDVVDPTAAHRPWWNLSPINAQRALLLTFGAATFGVVVATEALGGSGLVSAFAMGFAFSETARDAWNLNVSNNLRVFEKLFFTAVGVALPLSDLIDPTAIPLGLLFSVLAFVGKMVCGFGAIDMKTDFLTVGFAMIARGELGFIMLRLAKETNLINKKLEAICVWALVSNTLLAPFLFTFALRRRKVLLSKSTVVTADEPDFDSFSSDDSR